MSACDCSGSYIQTAGLNQKQVAWQEMISCCQPLIACDLCKALSNADVRLPCAMHYSVTWRHMRELFGNTKLKHLRGGMGSTLVPSAPGIGGQNVRDANPASVSPGTELTQTAAAGIITSFPTFPGMSCLANLTVCSDLGLEKTCHEAVEPVRGTISMPSE